MSASTSPGCAMSACKPYIGESEKNNCSESVISPNSYSGDDSYGDGYDSDHSIVPSGIKGSDKESRKNAEKQRRTVLNSLISQISSLLPIVATSNKKVDKTSILRLAANFLRTDHVFGDTIRECHKDVSPCGADNLLSMMGGFLITITVKGVIVVVSPNVVSFLGYSQVDLLGHNILSITHPEDVDFVKENINFCDRLQEDVKPALHEDKKRYYLTNQSSNECPRDRRDFLVRFAKAGSRSEPLQYILCRVDGTFRKADRAGRGEGRHIRRQRMRKDHVVTSSGNDYVFVGVVRLLGRPYISDRLLEASKQEYWTRHLVDGHIVHCDQRISLVAGYMSEEVVGVSAFAFMHKEDVRWVAIALRQMYDGNKLYGESCYRIVSRAGQFIYLRTRGFLEIDRSNRAAQSFVCINTLVSDEDGAKLITDMREKFSAIVDLDKSDFNTSLQRSTRGDDMTEDPQQIEQVVMHLVTNLPSSNSGHSRTRHYSHNSVSDDGMSTASTRSTESVNIIPPSQSVIKNCVAKAANVLAQSILAKKRVRSYCDLDSNGCKRPCYDVTHCISDSDKDYG